MVVAVAVGLWLGGGVFLYSTELREVRFCEVVVEWWRCWEGCRDRLGGLVGHGWKVWWCWIGCAGPMVLQHVGCMELWGDGRAESKRRRTESLFSTASPCVVDDEQCDLVTLLASMATRRIVTGLRGALAAWATPLRQHGLRGGMVCSQCQKRWSSVSQRPGSDRYEPYHNTILYRTNSIPESTSQAQSTPSSPPASSSNAQPKTTPCPPTATSTKRVQWWTKLTPSICRMNRF